MPKTRIVLLASLLFAANVNGQNIGINTTGAAPAASAMLDIDANNRGLLLPRVALASRNLANPVTAPAVSLVVYNTATAGTAPNNVFPGFYYWSGTEWLRMFSGRDAWMTTGNYGTAPASNFLGTADNMALRIRTNNLERFEVTTGTGGPTGTGGRLLAFQNGTATSPVYSWDASTGLGLFRQADNVMGIATGGLERLRFPNSPQIQAMDDGTATAPFYSWQSDPDIGMYRAGVNNLGFSTAGTQRMQIAANGNIGIGGTPANGAVMDIQHTTRGMLLPRVALVSLVSANPVGLGNVVDGLLVYNTATSGANPNMVTPGIYQWDGPNTRWRRFVNMVQEVWYVNPMNINANTSYTITANIPGVQWSSGVSVALAGDWPAPPDVSIQYIEARTNQVRFIVVNNTGGLMGGGTNYLNMDFNVTVTRW